jgi:polygalacturonase
MSGGIKNMFVSNCTFLGTDIGLRFKTTRGRGGVVEKVYIKDIYMKDIPGEAILFDMYYMAKDPIALPGEKRDAPKVEVLPVTAGTPQFRDFHISNVVCNGAATAIFIRGLPEMSISDLYLENMVLKAEKGIECIEAKNIHFKNIQLVTAQTNPVVQISNGTNISFNKIKYNNNAELLFSISGEKSSGIKVTNTDATKAKKQTLLGTGVPANVFEIQ